MLHIFAEKTQIPSRRDLEELAAGAFDAVALLALLAMLVGMVHGAGSPRTVRLDHALSSEIVAVALIAAFDVIAQPVAEVSQSLRKFMMSSERVNLPRSKSS